MYESFGFKSRNISQAIKYYKFEANKGHQASANELREIKGENKNESIT